MKTTVDLPDDLLIEAKKRAAETRTSLRTIIERALRRELTLGPDTEGSSARSSRIDWVTVAGGLPPGLDVADRPALWKWEERQR